MIERLAEFQSSLESAIDQGNLSQLGAHRRDPYIFTRRSLMAVLQYLSNEHHNASSSQHKIHKLRTGLCRYYLSRATNQDDRQTVMRLLDSAGLGVTSWRL